MRLIALLPAALTLCGLQAGAGQERGLAAKYPGDAGIERDPAVVFSEGFESGASRLLSKGRRIAADPKLALAGRSCLEVQHEKGTHNPYDVEIAIPPADRYYLRFYVRFEEGYDWGQGHKGPGFYAKAGGRTSGAGVRPTGSDKFSCRVCFHPRGQPHFYYYNPDQKGPYGDEPGQNVGAPVGLLPDRWYCIEVMLKANDAGQKNGEVKMWIDGELKGHYPGIRFRDTDELKINSFNNSAYFGGLWTAPKDQKRWEDNYVVATQHIGPMRREPAKPEKPAGLGLPPAAPPGEKAPEMSPDEKAARDLLAEGEKLLREGDRHAAKAFFERVRDQFPGTKYAEKALKHLEGMK